MAGTPFIVFFLSLLLLVSISAFQSDELLLDDDDFGLEGGVPSPPSPVRPSRRRSEPAAPDSSRSVHFLLDHAFGDGDFSPAGAFSSRVKTSVHGGQTLTKLRFSRNEFGSAEKEAFERLLKDDGFYMIRLPSNVLNPPGKDYVVSSIRARCLSRGSLDEHFVIHMDEVHILAVNYGSPGACHYPRLLKLPTKWSFNSYTVLKNSELARRTPTFAEEMIAAEDGEVEGVKPPEKSLWAKYWMYLVPLGFILLNGFTQAMNMPEEQSGSQSGAQPQQSVAQRAPSSAVRRR